MADDEKRKPSDFEKEINPTTMGGVRRLLSDPTKLDIAIKRGLGRVGPDPTFDPSRKRR